MIETVGVDIPSRVAQGADRFVGRASALREVSDWLQDGTERFLLVTGEPGAGKSAFAAWIGGRGPRPDGDLGATLDAVRARWGAQHFCLARSRGGTVDPVTFARSLASQLAQRYDRYATAAIERIAPEFDIELAVRENWGSIVGIKTETFVVQARDPEDVFDKSVRQPLQVLADENDVEIAILVDGLDEALLRDRVGISDLLAAADDLPQRVRFLLTTRRETRVLDRFDQETSRVIDLSADARSAENDEDIRAYVEQRITTDRGAAPTDDERAALADLVSRAGGNFLFAEFFLDEVAAGKRTLADAGTLPAELPSLYRAFLDRLFPAIAGDPAGMEEWGRMYRPLLGSLSVAIPAAPDKSLPLWLGWTKADIGPRLLTVGQLAEYVGDTGDGGGRRLYHRSLADFLAMSDVISRTGEPEPNRYFVSPSDRHREIVEYYLGGPWTSDWSSCDRYGLRQLAPHLFELLSSEEATSDARRRWATALYGLLFDPGFIRVQQERVGVDATLTAYRLALETALDRGDVADATRLLSDAAASAAPQLRGLAQEFLQRLHAVDRPASERLMHGLVR